MTNGAVGPFTPRAILAVCVVGLLACGPGTMAETMDPSMDATVDPVDAGAALPATDSGVGSGSDSGPGPDASPVAEDAGPQNPDAGGPPPTRVVFVYTGHGTMPEDWKPNGPRNAFELKPMLAPLTPFRDRMVMVDGLNAYPSPADTCLSVSNRCPGSLMSGVTGSFQAGPGRCEAEPYLCYMYGGSATIDHRMAELHGGQFPEPLIVAALALPVNRPEFDISYSGRDERLPAETDLGVLYRRISEADPVATPELASLVGRLTADADAIANETEDNRASFLLDTMTLALAQQTTRIVTYHLAPLTVSMTALQGNSVNRVAHSYAQGIISPDIEYNRSVFRDGQTWFAQQVAGLAERLDRIPEAGGTVLDHTVIVWFTDRGDAPSLHRPENVPVILLGGGIESLPFGEYLTISNGRLIDVFMTVAVGAGMSPGVFGPADDPARVLSELVR